jgi:hypothetical protein
MIMLSTVRRLFSDLSDLQSFTLAWCRLPIGRPQIGLIHVFGRRAWLPLHPASIQR